eukprot:1536505-Pleurochrysis_carterae.AAC.1
MQSAQFRLLSLDANRSSQRGHARKTRLSVLQDMFGETCLATEKRAGVAWMPTIPAKEGVRERLNCASCETCLARHVWQQKSGLVLLGYAIYACHRACNSSCSH